MRKIAAFFLFCARFVLVAVALLTFFHFFLLRPIFTSFLEIYWGVDIRLERAWIDFRSPGVVLEGIHFGNPYGFPRGEMLEIGRAEISLAHAGYEAGALRLEAVTLFIQKVNLMRRVSGHLNLEVLTDSPAQKQRGVRVIPRQTRFWVEQVSLIDASAPLLQRSEFVLDDQEFVFGPQNNFRLVAKSFGRELLKRISLREDEVYLPSPEYHGVVSAVEQQLREQAAEKAEEETSSSAFLI